MKGDVASFHYGLSNIEIRVARKEKEDQGVSLALMQKESLAMIN